MLQGGPRQARVDGDTVLPHKRKTTCEIIIQKKKLGYDLWERLYKSQCENHIQGGDTNADSNGKSDQMVVLHTSESVDHAIITIVAKQTRAAHAKSTIRGPLVMQ